MGKSLTDYQKAEQATADKQRDADYAAQSGKNNQITQDYINQIASIYAANEANMADKANANKAGLQQKYQRTYDVNAIQQLINERQVAEKMSQMGLTNSGLNATQQTAITVQRSNADNATRQTQNSESRSIDAQLADYINQQEAAKTQGESTAKYNTAQQNQTLWSNLDSKYDTLAYNNAVTAYTADQQRVAADQQRVAAEYQAQQNKQQLEQETAASLYQSLTSMTSTQQEAYLDYAVSIGMITQATRNKISTGLKQLKSVTPPNSTGSASQSTGSSSNNTYRTSHETSYTSSPSSSSNTSSQ